MSISLKILLTDYLLFQNKKIVILEKAIELVRKS